MSEINWASVEAKINKKLSTKAGVKLLSNAAQVKTGIKGIKISIGSDGSLVANETVAIRAAEEFISILQNQIRSSSIGGEIAEFLCNLDHSEPRPISNGEYEIDVFFTGDLYRKSLKEKKYGGIDNIAALLNNGVDHVMLPVRGMWHGNYIRSRTVIDGEGFMGIAVDMFKSSGLKYGLRDIVLSDEYE